jgi:hypothetical protein
MLRAFAVFALVCVGVLAIATGGHVGNVDLTAMPVPMLAFIGVTALLLLGLRHI